MRCSGCGIDVSEGMSFCPRCGRQLGVPPFYGQTLGQRPRQAAGESERSTLTLVLAIVIIVLVVPIVLSAVLYFMVVGFGTSDGTGPVSSLVSEPVQSGERITFVSISRATVWSDVTIVLSDGRDSIAWTPSTSELDNGIETTAQYPVVMLGNISVFCNITDLAGNGRINGGDFFTLTTGSLNRFDAPGTYLVAVIYDPNGGPICSTVF